MATKTPKTSKTSTKKTSTRKSSKTSVLTPLVKEKKTETKTVRVKKSNEDKFKFVAFIYKYKDKDQVAIIDGMVDYVDNFCSNSTSDYIIEEKVESRIYNEIERLDGTMDSDIEKRRKEFLEKIQNT